MEIHVEIERKIRPKALSGYQIEIHVEIHMEILTKIFPESL